MVTLGYKISGKKYIRVNSKNATWRDKLPVNSKCVHFDQKELMEAVELLLENIYIKFKNSVYKQNVGIPIGSDCAQELANLYLLSYEYSYVMSLRDNGHEDSHFLQYPNRYIDDLLSLNDSGYIERVYKDIYPDVMVLNKTNNTPDKATYLDINIEIINGKFVTKIYDKRRDFNFKIISLPHISGNVPVTPTYGVFISQVHRFFTANNSIEGFYAEVKALTSKLVKQGFTRNKMKYFLVKYVHNRFLDITFKYWAKFDICRCF